MLLNKNGKIKLHMETQHLGCFILDSNDFTCNPALNYKHIHQTAVNRIYTIILKNSSPDSTNAIHSHNQI